jgi:monovalent cation/proton antiporter MnhG/PhaG subunit
MSAAVEILAALLLVAGASVVALAALGVARLPDPFSRMHAAAKAGVAGAGLLLLGAGLAFGTTGAILTAAAAVVFLVLTAPLASHALGRAAYVAGAPLGAASVADGLAGVLDRRVFDIDPARTARRQAAARLDFQGEHAMHAIPEFRRPNPSGHDVPGAAPAPLRRILVCLAGGPAQRPAVAEAMALAERHGAIVVGLSGAGLEPRGWRGPLPVGGAHWAERLARRSRARMRQDAADALGEFQEEAAAAPHIEAVARHEEGAPGELARLLAGQDLVVVPAGTGPHGPENHPEHETAALLRAAGIAPVLRVRQRPGAMRGVVLVVGPQPGCGALAAGLLRSGLWSSAPVAILPVAEGRPGVREMAEAQAELLRAHGRRVALMAAADQDFGVEELRTRLAFFDAAVVPCLSTRYGGLFDIVRACAFETTTETVPLILLP